MLQRLSATLLATALLGAASFGQAALAAPAVVLASGGQLQAAPSPLPGMLPVATIQTTKGTITLELYTDRAPITANNFISLARRHFFDGLTFHRVVPGFVIQGGDPLGTGEGGSDRTIPLEIGKGLSHDAAGVMAMARDSRPDSASSQFYITLGPTTRLDGNYAIFGRVLTGLDVVMKIEIGDRMKTVTVTP